MMQSGEDEVELQNRAAAERCAHALMATRSGALYETCQLVVASACATMLSTERCAELRAVARSAVEDIARERRVAQIDSRAAQFRTMKAALWEVREFETLREELERHLLDGEAAGCVRLLASEMCAAARASGAKFVGGGERANPVDFVQVEPSEELAERAKELSRAALAQSALKRKLSGDSSAVANVGTDRGADRLKQQSKALLPAEDVEFLDGRPIKLSKIQ